MIDLLTSNLQAVGDDCAVLPGLNSEYDLVLTSDPLIEGVHFTRDALAPEIGHKAVCRVLSDFAAMGAEPQYLLVNLVAAPEQDVEVLQDIYTEFDRLRELYGAEVVGGDVAQGPLLELHVFGVGRVLKGTAVLRSGAKPGDFIFVTGALGCAQESGRHLTFEPRLKEGNWLRKSGWVTSMMDISDGLATDLRHILKASGVGANLDSKRIPSNGTIENALFDGEDFELLFTVSEADAESLKTAFHNQFGRELIQLGVIREGAEELKLDESLLTQKAYEHFKK